LMQTPSKERALDLELQCKLDIKMMSKK
jgi:hypothetical protein